MDLKSEAIVNPGAFFADALRTHLASKGITIEGNIRRADKPLGGSAIPPNQQNRRHARNQNLRRPQAASTAKARTTSPKASSRCLAAYMQKQGKDEPGSWANGEIATKAFLKANNIDASKYVAADGSGLSRENRVTSRLISDVFVTMWKHPHEDLLREPRDRRH